MSTPAPPQSAPPLASTPAPALDSKRQKRAEKYVAAWLRVYKRFKPVEALVEAARAKLTQLLVDAKVQSVTTKHGTLSLQTMDTINWQAIARAVIEPKFLEQLIAANTTTSKPYLRALPSWSEQ